LRRREIAPAAYGPTTERQPHHRKRMDRMAGIHPSIAPSASFPPSSREC